jgi:calcyphosin
VEVRTRAGIKRLRPRRRLTLVGPSIGANGVRTLTAMLKRMDQNGNMKLEREELAEGFLVYGIQIDDGPVRPDPLACAVARPGADAPRACVRVTVWDPQDGDLDKIMSYFDLDDDGHISLAEFIRGIRGSMAKERKLLVREAFKRLDKTGDGVVTIDDIILAYDASKHPSVIGGKMTSEEALKDLLSTYEGRRKNADGTVTWPEFLEYYRVRAVPCCAASDPD